MPLEPALSSSPHKQNKKQLPSRLPWNLVDFPVCYKYISPLFSLSLSVSESEKTVSKRWILVDGKLDTGVTTSLMC